MNTKENKQLTIFSPIEKFAFYGLPDFDNLQRKNYFSFSKNELQLIIKNKYKHVNLYTALQQKFYNEVQHREM